MLHAACYTVTSSLPDTAILLGLGMLLAFADIQSSRKPKSVWSMSPSAEGLNHNHGRTIQVLSGRSKHDGPVSTATSALCSSVYDTALMMTWHSHLGCVIMLQGLHVTATCILGSAHSATCTQHRTAQHSTAQHSTAQHSMGATNSCLNVV